MNAGSKLHVGGGADYDDTHPLSFRGHVGSWETLPPSRPRIALLGKLLGTVPLENLERSAERDQGVGIVTETWFE